MSSMASSLMSIGGDIKFLRLKQRGIDGLVCDGGVRDMKSVDKYNIRIWGYGRTSNLGTTVGTPYSTNEPVRVDGVLVLPGDYIVADDDGVVVIPRKIAAEVAVAAIEYDNLETWIKNRLEKENSRILFLLRMFSTLIESNISLIFLSKLTSLVNNKFLTTCWVMVDAPISLWLVNIEIILNILALNIAIISIP